MPLKKVLLANPRGFCAGVERAIDVVNLALQRFGSPIYVRREIVHNKYVIRSLAAKGAVFVDELDEVPEGAVAIFSAHGVSPDVRARAAAKDLKVIDATCPLVTKVHGEAIRYAREGRFIILVGHAGHDEVIGTMGEVPGQIQLVGSVEEAENVQVPDPDRVAVTTQTTLGVDDANVIIEVLRRRFPKLLAPASDDICYATQNRQTAVKEVAHQTDLLLVVGSDNSSNSNRLVEVARNHGTPSYLIENYKAIDAKWLAGVKTVTLTAGASAPECLVEEVVSYLTQVGYDNVREIEVMPENVRFGLPPEIVEAIAPAAANAE